MNHPVKAWAPSVGMRIQYKYKRIDVESGEDPVTAEVLQIDDRNALQVHHETGGRKTVWLSPKTWASRWEPAPEPTAKPAPKVQPAFAFPTLISEADVRRIVREELTRAFALTP